MRQITFEVPSQVALDFAEEMTSKGIEAAIVGVDDEDFILCVEYDREDEKKIADLEDYLETLIDEDDDSNEDEEGDDDEYEDEDEEGNER